MANYRGARSLRSSGISEQQQRIDVTALLTAKLVYDGLGDRLALEQTLAEMYQDPERMGQCMLGILNLLVQYATMSGLKPDGLKELTDYMITQLQNNKSEVRRMRR
jgi:hypothetical protein